MYSLLLVTLLTAPLVFYPNLSDFSNLPQRIYLETAALLLLLAWCVQQIRSRAVRLSRLPLLGIPLLTFIAWALFSASYAHDPLESWRIGRQWLLAVFFFLLIVQLRPAPEQRHRILAALLAAAWLVALHGILQHLFDFSISSQMVPPAANYGNKNMAAHYIVLLFPIGPLFLLNSRSTRAAWTFSLGTGLLLTYLVYTGTRAAWLAIAVQSLLAVLCLRFSRFPSASSLWTREKKRASLFGLLLVLTLINFGPDGFKPVYQSLGTRLSSGASAVLRLEIWSDTLALVEQNPGIGLGLGNMKIHFPTVQKKTLHLYKLSLKNSHNDYLQILVELGAVGLVLFFFLAAATLHALFRTARQHKENAPGFLEALALGLSLAGIGVVAFFCFPFERMIPLWVIMVFLGLIASSNPLCGNDRSLIVSPRFAAYCLLVVFLLSPFLLADNLSAIAANHFFFKANVATTKGDWPEVIRNGKKALRYYPSDLNPNIYIGPAYQRIGNHRAALDFLLPFLLRNPHHYRTLLNTAAAFYGLADYKTAEQYAKKAIAIVPIAGEAHGLLGLISFKQQQYGKAREEVLAAIQLDPKKNRRYRQDLKLIEWAEEHSAKISRPASRSSYSTSAKKSPGRSLRPSPP